MAEPLITQFNKWVGTQYYNDGFSKQLNIPKPYRLTSNSLNLAIDKKTYAFNIKPVKDIRFDLPKQLVTDIRNAIKGNVVREKLLTLIHQPGFESMILSYLFGAYIGSLPPDKPGFFYKPINLTGPKASMIKSLLTTRTKLSVPMTMFKGPLNPKIVLLGYIENDLNYRVSGQSVVVTNSQRITQLLNDNSWGYIDAGELLVIPDVFSLLQDVSDFSFELFINISNSVSKVMSLIAGSRSEKIDIKDLQSFIEYYPGFIFHSKMGDSYAFSDYQSWDLQSYVRGRQNEGLAFELVYKYMSDLIEELGLYPNEYETAHVLVGTKHYDIPTLSLDLAYIMNKCFNVGSTPEYKSAYAVWDAKIVSLKEKLNKFFIKKLEELKRNENM